ASSVDAERAFSGGRLQVNHLQHQTSSQAFKAPVALGFLDWHSLVTQFQEGSRDNGEF
ncbi:hypothetical protein B0H14DRAFT_2402094, partial [Mycena olivaceomarginata]